MTLSLSPIASHLKPEEPPRATVRSKNQKFTGGVATVATIATNSPERDGSDEPRQGEASTRIWCCVCGRFPPELRDKETFFWGASFYCVGCYPAEGLSRSL